MRRIYLDYAASTPVDAVVLRAMKPYFNIQFGNPGSLHSFGQAAMAAIDEARQTIAKTIGADFREIIFTGSATEANNLALRGVLNARLAVFRNQNNFAPAAKFSFPSARHSARGGNQAGAPAGYSSKQSSRAPQFLPRIIVSAIEHESVLDTARNLERDGAEVIYLPVSKEGLVDLAELKKALNERTILVSVMYANNEIGTIQPIAEISKIIQSFKIAHELKPALLRRVRLGRRPGDTLSKSAEFSSFYPLFHTDAVQAFQFLDCDVDVLGVDLMTLSAHKIYGPKGVGCLYIRGGAKNLESVITGGGQEFGLRSGTENVPGIAGFSKAAELAAKGRVKETKRLGELKNYFWWELKKVFPKARVNVNPEKSLPNILNVCFPGHKSENLLIQLDRLGLAVSSGSACSVRSSKPSHVLKAVGLPIEDVQSSLRFSFGRFTTKQELNESLKKIKKALFS